MIYITNNYKIKLERVLMNNCYKQIKLLTGNQFKLKLLQISNWYERIMDSNKISLWIREKERKGNQKSILNLRSHITTFLQSKFRFSKSTESEEM